MNTTTTTPAASTLSPLCAHFARNYSDPTNRPWHGDGSSNQRHGCDCSACAPRRAVCQCGVCAMLRTADPLAVLAGSKVVAR